MFMTCAFYVVFFFFISISELNFSLLMTRVQLRETTATFLLLLFQIAQLFTFPLLGSYRECIALMRRMVKDFPNDVDVLNKYGVLMLTIGKNDRATPVYENVSS